MKSSVDAKGSGLTTGEASRAASGRKRGERGTAARRAAGALQNALGLALLAGTAALCFSGFMYDPATGGTDCTFALATVPAGLALLLSRRRLL